MGQWRRSFRCLKFRTMCEDAGQLAELIPFYDLRFVEKAGITGWAQIRHRYSSSLTEQIERFYFDYHYVRTRSVALELYVMLLTASVVARMKGT